MRPRRIAMTGPAAAALHGLDGYRDLNWPATWCAPPGGVQAPSVLRTRSWEAPVLVDDVAVAPIRLVLRHLGWFEHCQPDDGLGVADRVELALEHALRSEAVELSELRVRGACGPGDAVLRQVIERRGNEPPTESYAETRAVQVLRGFGWTPWRQLRVMDGARIAYRVDLVIPFGGRRRPPKAVLPHDGLLVEIDGRSVHEPQFERDHDRQTLYDALGFSWVSFTPRQIEQRPAEVKAAINARLRRNNAVRRPKLRGSAKNPGG